MPVLDDRIRDALGALAPDPAPTDVVRATRARRARDRRRRALAGAALAIAVLAGATAAVDATRDGDDGSVLDATAPSTTMMSTTVPSTVAPTTTQVLASDDVIIPEVAGLAPVDATQALARLGFDVERADESSDTVAEGLVTRTDPGAGSSVQVNGKLTLYVSSGLPDGIVPQLVPLTTEAAIEAITAAGFKPSAVPSDVPEGGAEASKVITQNPPAGTNAKKGSTVEFTYGRPTP